MAEIDLVMKVFLLTWKDIHNIFFCKFLNLYSQYNPGRCEEFSAGIDSKEKRLFYLKECLMSLADFISLYHMESDPEQIIIGVPWMIGCGIAGNDINATFELFKTIFEPLKKHVKIMFVDFN